MLYKLADHQLLLSQQPMQIQGMHDLLRKVLKAQAGQMANQMEVLLLHNNNQHQRKNEVFLHRLPLLKNLVVDVHKA